MHGELLLLGSAGHAYEVVKGEVRQGSLSRRSRVSRTMLAAQLLQDVMVIQPLAFPEQVRFALAHKSWLL